MNVALYDTEHFETTFTMIRALDDGTNYIRVFTTPELADILKQMPGMQSGAISWQLLHKGGRNHAPKLFQYCRRNDVQLFLLNTVSSQHLFFGIVCRLLKKTKTLLTVHDANSFFRPALRLTPRGILRSGGKKFLRHHVDGFITLLTATEEYINKEFAPAQPVYSIPGSFFEDQNLEDNRFTRIRIAIPGSVDTKRRDYEQLFQLLSLLQSQDVDVVLLGAAKDEEGRRVIEKCKSLQSSALQVEVYE